MVQFIEKLSAVRIARLKKPGLYADGGGLYLQVSGDGAEHITKSWIFRFMISGRAREMGLGSFATFSLADAREKAAQCRKLQDEGIDPIEARKAQRAQQALEAAKSMTFKDCAEKYIRAHKMGWRNAKHAAQWDSTLKTYAEPIMGKLPVQSIDTVLVTKVLEPIWSTKAETASRLRGRIEVILDWATVQGLRAGENPARWRGHLDKLLPARSRIQRIKHHAALPYADIPAFMLNLRAQDGIAARALEFLILTAARTGEVISAQHMEVANNVWIVPAERMKGRKEHRVPLSGPAIALITKMQREYGSNFIFPGADPKKPLSNMAMLQLLERMKRHDLTAHGFRSTFRDWASECTNFPSEVVEMALAHTIDNKVEAAYRRGDLFNKRVTLMNDWARYCLGRAGSEPGQILVIHSLSDHVRDTGS